MQLPTIYAEYFASALRHATDKLKEMTIGPARLDAYYARRRFHALVAAALFTCLTPLFISLAFFGTGKGLPPVSTLTLAFIANGLAATLCYRRVAHAPTAFAWLWGVLIPLIMVEPSINYVTDYTLLIPPALGLMLGGWRSVVGLGVLPTLLLVLRAKSPRLSPYVDPAFLLVHATVVATLVATHRAFVKAMKDDARSHSLMDVIARASDDIVIVRNGPKGGAPGSVRFVSQAVTKCLGYSVQEVLEAASGFGSQVHPEDLPAFLALQQRAHQADCPPEALEFRVRHKLGQWVWMSARSMNLMGEPEVSGIVTTLRDITAERAAREALEAKERDARASHEFALEHRANHDELTGLPTRRKLTADLEQWVERRRQGEAVRVAVIFCDIDAFKHVNDGLGHGVGDELLCTLTKSMQTAISGRAVLYRFGGDEFVALVSAEETDRAPELAEAMAGVVRTPIALRSHRLVVTSSIGVAYLDTHIAADSLLRDADVAMYEAKEQGKNRVVVFDGIMQKRALRRHTVEQSMRRGIAKGEFRSVFQPKVNTQTRTLVGFETLLRWRCPELGDVSPVEFIPIAEETGLILELGRIALRQACEMIVKQGKESGKIVPLSVNVSVEQMLDSARLLRETSEIFSETGVSPRHIELEITESLLLKQIDIVVAALTELKALGVTLSVDDFGTGYSSLSYLRRFPIDTIKVDRTFVTNLAANQDNYAIVSAILSLARNLGLHTVAEGVETEAEFNVIASLGCDDVQGYLISKPLELEAALAFRRDATAAVSRVLRTKQAIA
jgi:diguanylate cyclase (GGDEF)-like protein/PAS domain S-box-containing protein